MLRRTATVGLAGTVGLSGVVQSDSKTSSDVGLEIPAKEFSSDIGSIVDDSEVLYTKQSGDNILVMLDAEGINKKLPSMAKSNTHSDVLARLRSSPPVERVEQQIEGRQNGAIQSFYETSNQADRSEWGHSILRHEVSVRKAKVVQRTHKDGGGR